jgi:very-short-patch-repair endonuclease
MLRLGADARQIEWAVTRRRLLPIHRGVYAVAGVPLTPNLHLLAATLAGEGVASHRSAAQLLGLVDVPPSRPEITVPRAASNRGSWIAHRSADLLRRDLVTLEGIRSTNAARTLIDLGSVVNELILETALERALYQRLTTVDRLVRRFFELARRGRPGIAALRPLLVQRDPTLAPAQSDLETLLFKILRDAGLPPPTRQFEVFVAGQRFFLDLAYPDEMVFMEGDGFGVHTMRSRFEGDRSRQNLLVGIGWRPLRFTWRRLCRAPRGVVEEVQQTRALRVNRSWRS